jgi:hypothetical protein
MRSLRRSVSAFIALGIIVVSTLPADAIVTSGANAASAVPFGRAKIADAPRSIFPVRDFGRRRALANVSATVTLRYNHQAELDALVTAQGNRRSPLYHHFLTSAQFDNYFAPTLQQQRIVVAALQSAGIHVTHSYSNRTLLDLQGTSASVERFFDTEIHSLSQRSFGMRFANVKPATIPADLAPLVRTVSLSNFIVARTGPHVRPFGANVALAARRPAPLGRFKMPAYVRPRTGSPGTNVVADPGFESHAFGRGWSRCDTPHAAPLGSIASTLAHRGRYSARAGSINSRSGEQLGYAGVCQLVTIPAKSILTAYLYGSTNEPTTRYAAEDVLLLKPNGTVAATLARSVVNRAAWVAHRWNLEAFAGKQLYIYFGVHGDGYRRGYTIQFADDVSLIGARPAPPAPTPAPTAAPTIHPTATPTMNPTATPTMDPTPTPTPVQTPVPTAAPTTMPVAACAGVPDAGAFDDGGGYLATGVAAAFDYPVQHGCNGAGRTVAVEISSPVVQGDIDAYMSAAGIRQSGIVTNVPIDGGGTYNPTGDDTLEATLDVETIVGLAPGANVRVYEFPELSDNAIEDAYDQTVTDGVASVTNSSFGGCESEDPSFSATTNAIAEQAAAEGITFVASSGDSGSDECYTNNSPPGPATPAGDPYFVAVGGVNFTEDAFGTLTSLTAVGDPIYTGFLSGGGVSTLYALPAYQAGIGNVIGSGRNSPDISLPGVDVAIYLGGGTVDADGTSWSSPAFVALLAEASQLHQATGFGYVNAAIYSTFASLGYSAFTDVTVGGNGAYAALPGYDQVTGIGTPKGYAFATAL